MNKINLIIAFLITVSTVNATFAQIKMKKLATLDLDMSETSGLVYYQNEFLITHNDGGNASEIYILNLKGVLDRVIEVENAKNEDWEDLTQDDEGRLFIGDFGNNDNRREKNQIYILPKKFIDQKKVEAKKITFSYEDQHDFPPKDKNLNFDCEGFFWKNDKLYLFTKCRTKPFSGETRVYELPAKAGNYKAKYIGSLFLCQSGWRFCSVTSVDYNPKTNSIAVLTYSKLYILSDFNGHNFWEGKVREYPLPLIKQREAVCFKSDNTLYMTDEVKRGLGGGNLYEIKLGNTIK